MDNDIQKANREKTLGNECFTAKNYHEAVKHFTNAIDLNPDDHVFYSNRSACYANLEEYDKALVDAQICVDLKPDWTKGYLRRGLAEYHLNKLDQAEKTYKEGLKLEPNNQQLVEGLQKVQEAKSTKAAEGSTSGVDKEKFFQQALAQLKTDPETANFFQDKEFVNKLNEIKSDPQKLSLYMNDPKIKKAFEILKTKFSGKGAGTSSTKDHGYTRSHESHKPSSSSIAAAEEEKTKGNDEYKRKNFEKAIYHYDKAIELNPNEPIYYNNKAAVYLELKEIDKVIDCCDKAILLCRTAGNHDSTKLAKALVRKAAANVHKQNYDEAIKLYSESLRENNDPKVKEEIIRLDQLKKEAENI